MATASVFTELSDQVSHVTEEGDHFVFTLERCPLCWKRTSDRPVHYMMQGFLQEELRQISGGAEFTVELTTCIAAGDDIGRCVVYKQPIG